MKLTDKEASNIELNKLQNDLAARDIQIVRLEVLVAELRHKMLVQEASNKIQALIQEKEKIKVERVALIEPIKKKLGIDGPFGFDPDTLEVITTEEG